MPEKTTKKYQLLKSFQLSTVFLVNGNIIPVTFAHGTRRPFLMRGMFSTDAPDLQKAIESDNAYGVEFCEMKAKEQDIPADVPPIKKKDTKEKAKEEEKPPVKDIPKEGDNDTENKEPIAVDYPEVTNLQEARQKMFDLFPGEFKPANLPNKPAVLNKAKAKNITFSKLK